MVPGNNYNGNNSMATRCGKDINNLNTIHDHSRTRQDLEDYKDAKGECSATSESCYKMSFDDGVEVNYDRFKEESIKIEEYEGDNFIKSEMLDTDSDAEISCSLRQWSELEIGYNLKMQDCNRSTQKQDFHSNDELESIKTELDTESNVAAMQSEYNDASAVVNDTVHEHSRTRHNLEDYNDAKEKCCTTSENCSETSFHDGVEMNCNSFKEENIDIEEHELDSLIKTEIFDTNSDAEISCSLRQWSEFENGIKLELQDYNRCTPNQEFDSNDQLESVKTELDKESNVAAMQSEYNDASVVGNDTAAEQISLPGPSNSDHFEEHNKSSRKNSTNYSGLLRQYNKLNPMNYNANVENCNSSTTSAESFTKQGNCVAKSQVLNICHQKEKNINKKIVAKSERHSELLRDCRVVLTRMDVMDIMEAQVKKSSNLKWDVNIKSNNTAPTATEAEADLHSACFRQDHLIGHMRKHTGEKPVKCVQCDYACSRQDQLIRHMRKHTGENPYKCDQCKYAFSRKSRLIIHMRKHTGGKPYKCDQCGYACSIKGSLKIHMRNHTGEKPYKCDQCDYACSAKHNMKNHMVKHTGEKPYKCDQCKYRSSRKSDLIMHMRKHTGEKPYKCDQCDYACSAKHNMKNHMVKHTGEKPYKCDQCKYRSYRKSDLIIHMRKHTGEKPYKCDQCKYRSSRKSDLIMHMTKHTGEKPYKCDQCGYACSIKGSLKIHMRNHTGEKPYKCDQCGYACSIKGSLKIHMRNHTGEKPYKCDQCDYACSAKNNLKKHMVKHTGEKPYKCDQCHYSCSRKSSLIMHMRKHRGEKPYKCN